MKYFAMFDEHGERETTYIEGIHFEITDGVITPPLPDGFIEISVEDQDLYASGDYIRNADGFPEKRPEYEPTIEDTINAYTIMVQGRLDSFAQTLMYDNIVSACTYATSTVPMYAAEGQYCVEARDKTWQKAYELMQEIVPLVEAGNAIPTWETIEMQLPVLEWPEGTRGLVST